MMHRPFIRTGLVGLLVILSSLVLLGIFPSSMPRLPEGFSTPIIAFEFIETRSEVFQMFTAADGSVRRDLAAAMDLGNRLDFVYMVLYGLFLALFCAKCAGLSRQKLYYTGTLLAVGAVLADVFENLQLLGITAGLDSGDVGQYLFRLQIFTWMKWGGICAVFLVLVPWLWKRGGFARSIAAGAVLTAMTGLGAFLRRSFMNEIFSLCVAVMFLMMIVFCFVYKSRDVKPENVH